MTFFVNIEKTCMEPQKILHNQTVPRKGNKPGGILVAHFKPTSKPKQHGPGIKIGTEPEGHDREFNKKYPCIYSQMISNKDNRNTLWRKESFFNK